jgi:hypothetical protein
MVQPEYSTLFYLSGTLVLSQNRVAITRYPPPKPPDLNKEGDKWRANFPVLQPWVARSVVVPR